MNAKMLLEYSSITELIVCLSMFVLLWRKGALREFRWIAAMLAVHATYEAVTVPFMFFRRATGVNVYLAYNVIFYAYWINFVLESVLSVLVVYAIYKVAMKPLKGLSHVGTLIFKWVSMVSILLAVSIVVVPHTSADTLQIVTQRLQQGLNVVMLCLLLFVCFAIKPLGLTYRSRIFGVSLGLGMLATTSLAEAAWFSTSAARSVYSPIYVFGAAGYLAALLTWGTFFSMPEPKRKMVLLPTTSPYFLWNRVSEALGDAPGHIAIAGFTPDMLAPAELKVLTAGSKFARDNRQRREDAALQQTSAQEARSFPSIAMQG
jgi:hypothetical protein